MITFRDNHERAVWTAAMAARMQFFPPTEGGWNGELLCESADSIVEDYRLRNETNDDPNVQIQHEPIAPGLVVYLASPYSDDDPKIVEERYRITRAVTAAMLRWGTHVYSPIVHCHALAQAHKLPTDAEFWRAYNLAMLRKCDVLAVLEIDGHDTSKGVLGEIAYATERLIPIVRVSLGKEDKK